MLPNPMLPPGLQIAASDRREAACENEEEYAQKYGRVVDHRRIIRRGRMIAIALLIGLMILFM